MHPRDTVDVVIPTLGRESLITALGSVRRQEGQFEARVIVVLDDPARQAFVRTLLLPGEALSVIAGRGGAAARNHGLELARGCFVAFLDDDDWWEPNKLALQLEEMHATRADLSFTGTYFHGAGGHKRLLPRLPLPELQQVPSYLVQRTRIRHGDGYLQTSSLVLRASVLGHVRWAEDLRKHQDWDYIVRLLAVTDRVTLVARPLVHVQQGSVASVSKSRDWRVSQVWLERHGDLLSARARGDFIATQVLRSALAAGDMRAAGRACRSLLRSRPHAAALVPAGLGVVEYLKRVRRQRGTKSGA